MPVCKNCGEFYISKECPHCDKTKSTDKTTKKGYLAIGTLLIVTLIVGINLYKNNGFNTNPIIGTWRSSKSIPFVGRQTIQFRPDSVITMGVYSKAKYEVEENTIIVTDSTGIGTVYRVIDKNTIYSETLGIKTVFRRLK